MKWTITAVLLGWALGLGTGCSTIIGLIVQQANRFVAAFALQITQQGHG